VSGWRVTIRTGPRVEKLRAPTLTAALELLETEARAAAATTRRGTIDARFRTFEPKDQVATRTELRGPGVRAGIDVRGDGTVQAWSGRLRREALEPAPSEDAYDALRQALEGT
jgi:hypothetical protein